MKNIIRFFNTIIIAGIVLIMGTAGVCDNSHIEFVLVLKRVAVSVAMIIAGVWGRHSVVQANERMKKRYKDNLSAAIKMMRA